MKILFGYNEATGVKQLGITYIPKVELFNKIYPAGIRFGFFFFYIEIMFGKVREKDGKVPSYDFWGLKDNTVRDVDFEDFALSWRKFHKKYPNVDKWEYEWGVKKYQEM